MLLLREVQWNTLLLAVGIMAGLAIVFAVVIVIVAKYMTVNDEDERISDVRKLLAGANCGGCGKAGCDDFAKALCKGEVDLSACNPTSAVNKARIAELLQIEFTSGGEKKAVIKCGGGNKCADKFEYQGYGNCVNQVMLAGGRKVCPVGCMGSGSCVAVCPENAIKQKDGRALVDDQKCVACGACVSACPKHLIELVPKEAKVLVACSNHCKGREVADACKVGCVSCGMCVKACEFGAITMNDGLPVIDYSKCTGCKKCVEACKRHTIHEID